MSIIKSMQTSVSGLSANTEGMSVISNNIANSNTKGYKYDRAEFEDMLSVDLQSGDGQIGRGTRLSGVKVIHNQGSIQATDSLTDLAIQGNGFFMVSNPNMEAQESGGVFYTRAGNFIFDKDGYLSDNAGGHVKGYLADERGNLSSELTDIRLLTNHLKPVQTSKLDVNVNLDSRTKFTGKVFDINDPEVTSDYSTSVTVLDSQGAAHAVTIYFNRLEDTSGNVTWESHYTLDSSELSNPAGNQRLTEVGSGKLVFNEDGFLLNDENPPLSLSFNNGAKLDQQVTVDFGKSITEGGTGSDASTSIAIDSETVYHAQNGHSAGHLKTLKIELDGSIVGFYTNGLQQTMGAVALATFENNQGLKRAGHNQFYSTYKSGEPQIGRPSTGSRGGIYSGSLEESNVDLAKQFVDMIMTQRAFQANAKTITTGDSMLEEVINIRR